MRRRETNYRKSRRRMQQHGLKGVKKRVAVQRGRVPAPAKTGSKRADIRMRELLVYIGGPNVVRQRAKTNDQAYEFLWKQFNELEAALFKAGWTGVTGPEGDISDWVDNRYDEVTGWIGKSVKRTYGPLEGPNAIHTLQQVDIQLDGVRKQLGKVRKANVTTAVGYNMREAMNALREVEHAIDTAIRTISRFS